MAGEATAARVDGIALSAAGSLEMHELVLTEHAGSGAYAREVTDGYVTAIHTGFDSIVSPAAVGLAHLTVVAGGVGYRRRVRIRNRSATGGSVVDIRSQTKPQLGSLARNHSVNCRQIPWGARALDRRVA